MDTMIRNLERKLACGEQVSDTELKRAGQYDVFFADTLAERKHDRMLSQMRVLWDVTLAMDPDYRVHRYVNADGHWVYDSNGFETTQHVNETIYWHHKGWNTNTGEVIWERAFPVYGPKRPYRDDLFAAIASQFGLNQWNDWGDKHGTVTVWDITFHLRPKNNGGSSHRLKVECPACGKHYGPSKWRQHARYKHRELI